MFLCPGGTERKKQRQKDRAHADIYHHSHRDPTRGSMHFGQENCFFHVKEINSLLLTSPPPPSLPCCPQRVVMAVQLFVAKTNKEAGTPGQEGRWGHPALTSALTSIKESRRHGGVTPDSSTYCASYVPGVNHISGSGDNSPETSGAITLPSKLNLKLFDTVWYKHARLGFYFPQQFNLWQT